MGPSHIVFADAVLRERSRNVLLFLMTFQHFRDRVIGGAQDFFADQFESKNGQLISNLSDSYRQNVLSRAVHAFEACLLWYREMDAVSERDIAVALRLVDYRNDIAHDPSRVLMGNKYRGWALSRVNRLLRKIDAFWIQVSVDIDPDIPSDYDRGSATTVFRLLLNHFAHAISDSRG